MQPINKNTRMMKRSVIALELDYFNKQGNRI